MKSFSILLNLKHWVNKPKKWHLCRKCSSPRNDLKLISAAINHSMIRSKQWLDTNFNPSYSQMNGKFWFSLVLLLLLLWVECVKCFVWIFYLSGSVCGAFSAAAAAAAPATTYNYIVHTTSDTHTFVCIVCVCVYKHLYNAPHSDVSDANCGTRISHHEYTMKNTSE